MAAKKVVYDSVSTWHIGQYETIAAFSHNTNVMSVNFTNKSANAISYSWDFGDGNTSTVPNPTHTYTASGTYSVRLIAIGVSLCSDTTYMQLTLQSLSIAGTIEETMITVAPNPASGVLYIHANIFTKENYRIQLVNSIGKIVYEKQSASVATQSINVSGIASGVYTLNISKENGDVYHKKVIIQ